MPWYPRYPGWGRGVGWRWCFWATGLPGWMRFSPDYPFRRLEYPVYPSYPSEEDELKWLEEEEKLLEEELEYIRKRIRELRGE